MAGVCDLPVTTSKSFVWNSWFPTYGSWVQQASTECYALFQQQPTNFSAWGDPRPQDARCPDVYDLITCMWNRLPAWLQLDFSSAQVLLGLAPTILSLMAPSISEVSLLSSTRPLLSFLLSFGSPTLFSFRALQYDDPLDALRTQRPTLTQQSIFKQHHAEGMSRAQAAVSAAEYLVALLCMGNVMWTSWQIGLRTILTYHGGLLFLPFLWSTLGTLVHLVAAIGWHTSATMKAVRRDADVGRADLSFPQKARASIAQEFTLCSAAPRRNFLAHRQPEYAVTIALNIVAGFTGIVLLIFATATFSSLLFIGPLDALSIVIRYMVSTIVVRFIIMYELAGLLASEGDGYPGEMASSSYKFSDFPAPKLETYD